MDLLLLGTTGLVGRNVLAQALANPAVTRVIAPTRRPLEPHAKLTNPVSDRLEALLSEGIHQGIDGVVCALGTTIKKAGSKEAFREVDYALPLKFARAAHQHGVDKFVIVSASSAVWQDSSLRSQWWSYWSQHQGCATTSATDSQGNSTGTSGCQ